MTHAKSPTARAPGGLSPAASEYLETIYNTTVEGDPVVGARLAEKFGVSPASVSEMLQRLVRDGYLRVDSPAGPLLTDQGMAAAERSLRHHRLAERFLFDVLHMNWITAHEEAHALQQALTPAIEAGMVALLNNPTTCPHGNPIPGSGPPPLEFLRAQNAQRLSQAPAAIPLMVLCISEVVEDETRLLRYLGEKGLHPGTRIVVQDRGPDERGPLMLEVAGQMLALSEWVAGKVWVCAPRDPPDARRRPVAQERTRDGA